MQWSMDEFNTDPNANINHQKWITLSETYPPLNQREVEDDARAKVIHHGDGMKPLAAFGPIFESLNLRPGLEYKYRVRGENKVGWSPWTDASEPFMTLSSIPDTPDAPVGLETTTSSITIQWITPVSNGPPVTAYEIQHQRLNKDENEHYGKSYNRKAKKRAVQSRIWKRTVV